MVDRATRAMKSTPRLPVRTRAPALGLLRGNGMRRLVIDFDDEMFAALRSRAVRERTSVGEQVRTMVEWGLESAEKPT